MKVEKEYVIYFFENVQTIIRDKNQEMSPEDENEKIK